MEYKDQEVVQYSLEATLTAIIQCNISGDAQGNVEEAKRFMKLFEQLALIPDGIPPKDLQQIATKLNQSLFLGDAFKRSYAKAIETIRRQGAMAGTLAVPKAWHQMALAFLEAHKRLRAFGKLDIFPTEFIEVAKNIQGFFGPNNAVLQRRMESGNINLTPLYFPSPFSFGSYLLFFGLFLSASLFGGLASLTSFSGMNTTFISGLLTPISSMLATTPVVLPMIAFGLFAVLLLLSFYYTKELRPQVYEASFLRLSASLLLAAGILFVVPGVPMIIGLGALTLGSASSVFSIFVFSKTLAGKELSLTGRPGLWFSFLLAADVILLASPVVFFFLPIAVPSIVILSTFAAGGFFQFSQS